MQALPWLVEAPITAVARAMFELTLEPPPLLSVEWQRRLEAAGRRLDRYARFGAGDRGAGVAVVIDLCRGGWAAYLSEPPRSLGAIAVCAWRRSNEWRADDRARRGKRRRRGHVERLWSIEGRRFPL